jgi:hypothetical protein
VTEPVLHESHALVGGGTGRRAERVAVLAGVLVLLAVVKPWGADKPAEVAHRPAPSVAATERVFFADLPCTGGRWLIEADERWAGDVVRTWVLTDAAEATGPTDPQIRFVTVAAPQVLSIGYCPALWDDARPHSNLTIYRLGPPVAIVATSPFRIPKEADAAANDLFRPAASSAPGASGAAPGTWPAGRYVMRVDGPDGYRRWLGLEIRLILIDLPVAGSAAPEASGAP